MSQMYAKTEYNVPPETSMSQMYAKNRIQCAAGNVNEANVCEKPNTMCRRQAERGKCMRKTEHNVPTVGKRTKCMRKTEYNVPTIT
ncbi:hypothetical protein NST74_13060 [Paenibacillus sp. FSL F4-0125]|uniref:hypothetical protein n=1 Tax=Paenibacillus sp. FSL F4-0125 TaxID=2954730 RepID=UPI0030F675F1